MAMLIRAKRVSDPLDDRVKARLLRGGDDDRYASSGSEHEADALFSVPIHAFLDIDHDHGIKESLPDRLGHVSVDSNDDGDGDVAAADSDDYAPDDFVEEIRDLLDPSRKSDPFLARLHSDVAAIAIALGSYSGRMGSKRSVMARLRGRGYNAGICKARWESSGSSLTAGSYEYIDVVVDDKERESRYIVDIEFAAEFEVARATGEYTELVAALPRVMVGRGEEVKQVVRIMAEAARRSMKSRDLSVPPWRKRRYMLAKWFGQYRRTVNVLSSSAAVVPAKGSSPEEMLIKCRAVGFVATPEMHHILPPLATRTR